LSVLNVKNYATSVALVTGGAKRVGRAMVLQLIELGFDVAIHYFSSETEALDLKNDIEKSGGRADVFQSDLSDQKSLDRLFENVVEVMGCPSILVNNASIFIPEQLSSFSFESLNKNVGLHLATPLYLTKLMTESLGQDKHSPHLGRGERLVVNMLDQRVLNPSPGFTSYSASKYALAGVTKSLAIELAPNTRVAGIAPGPVLPPPFSDGKGFSDYCETMPLKRGSSPDEIAHVLKFLVESGSITGQILASDGGQHLGHLSSDEAIRNAKLKVN